MAEIAWVIPVGAGVLALLLVWRLTLRLRGPDLRHCDHALTDPLPTFWQHHRNTVAAQDQALVREHLQKTQQLVRGTPRRQRLGVLREVVDAMGDNLELAVEYRPVQVGGMGGEWVLAPGCDPRRRLLYIHGGAWTLGSARSHRAITAGLAQATGAAVLAINYRLMPEHPRLAGLQDCQSAYRWLQEQGPQGPQPVHCCWVAGDSAGGNLCLALLAWVRDQGLPPPQAAVALSPATDLTMASPSLRANVASDLMLGPLFGALARLPRDLLLWLSWLRLGLRPGDPRLSPLRGDLQGLPPTLLHASASEMLLDDSVRYAAKAQAAGSPVQLHTWQQVVHVWHIFHPRLPVASEALDHIAGFLLATVPRLPPQPGSPKV